MLVQMRWATLALLLPVGCALALAESNVSPREPIRSTRKLELGIHEGVTWPIINAPIDGPLPGAPVAPASDPRPAAPTIRSSRRRCSRSR